ncbi:hypothetical protein [Photobacterium leiognathi]|uniref:hypothetical protein n=1 Tax=Photobacterium leiognathi TaxID=553611 RepID=UPI002739F1D0|nr:hypothetical protein [Photobacterium leiognathi]
MSTINDWHSPTELKFTGNKTIEIQSLHVNNTNIALRQNNGSLSSGDVTVTGGSCITDGDVAPFGICTLEMKSGPYEGKSYSMMVMKLRLTAVKSQRLQIQTLTAKAKAKEAAL